MFEHGRPSDLTRANEHGETADCKSNQTFQNFTTETTKFTKCGLRGSPCQRPQPPWPGAPPRRHWRDTRALAQVTSSGVLPSTIRSCSQWSVAPATMTRVNLPPYCECYRPLDRSCISHRRGRYRRILFRQFVLVTVLVSILPRNDHVPDLDPLVFVCARRHVRADAPHHRDRVAKLMELLELLQRTDMQDTCIAGHSVHLLHAHKRCTLLLIPRDLRGQRAERVVIIKHSWGVCQIRVRSGPRAPFPSKFVKRSRSNPGPVSGPGPLGPSNPGGLAPPP